MTGTAIKIIEFLYQQPKDKLWEIKEKKKKRSLSQNAYYWELITQVSQKTKLSKYNIHNSNLRHCGYYKRINDCVITIALLDNDETERQVIESPSLHLEPTTQVREGKNGKMYRTYKMLRGSSEFNTAEMSHLLDLLIQDAEAEGIETLTSAELAKIREYEQRKEDARKDKSMSDQ